MSRSFRKRGLFSSKTSASFVRSLAPVTISEEQSLTSGDLAELRSQLAPTGAVSLGQSISGATEVDAGPSAAAALGSAWAGTKFYINSVGATETGFNAFREIIGVRRTRTLADLRKVG